MNGGIHHAPGGPRSTGVRPPPFGHKDSNATNITTTSSIDDPETPTDTAQVKFLPKSEHHMGSSHVVYRRWTKRERLLLGLCALFFILCVVFVAVAFTRDVQLRSKLSRASSQNVCMTKNCIRTASQLMEGMDFTADPCQDFFQFACGTWNRKHVIPEDKPTFNTFDKLHGELQIIVRDLLERKFNAEDSEATRKAKILYASCTNVSQVEKMGDKPLRAVIKNLGGWPILDDQWSSDDFVLEDVLGRMRKSYGSFLWNCGVGADDKNSAVNIIQIDQISLGMPSREYYLMDAHSYHLQAYRNFIASVVGLLGVEGPRVGIQVDEIVAFETQLANVTRPIEDRQDTGALYHKMKVRELQELIPTFDILRYLRRFIPDPITQDEPIVLFATQYIHDVVSIIDKTDKRIVSNYLVWRVIMDLVPELALPFQQAMTEYKAVLQGMKREQVRWKKCVEFVNERVGMAVGAMFVKKNFKKESRDTASEMIHDIRGAFNELLEENVWMDDKTRAFAKEKANSMDERIGYPDFITDPAQLNAFYAGLNFTTDQFFENILRLQEFDSHRMMAKLRQRIDQDMWDQEPVTVNAFYNPNTNDIVLPAGILQPLFYSASFPKSLNYGGIGVVIGHEITHGFDDKGRQYDKDGNIKQWWDNQTSEAFTNRAQCFIDQYSGFKLEQIDQYMNGKMTQGENIADNGGLKQAYRAYRKWVQKNGEEQDLPGIGLNHNQLFFLNYAQIWCGKMRDEEALRKIRISAHSLGPIRVFGPLSNSREFSEAYGCPLGSRMNPQHKCAVW